MKSVRFSARTAFFILMAVCVFAVAAFVLVSCGSKAENGSKGLNFTMQSDGTYGVRAGSCTDSDIVIPSSYLGVPVTRVLEDFFGDNAPHKEVTVRVPEGVTEVENSAFEECIFLSRIYLPSTLKRVGNYAFDRCVGLSDVIFENGSRVEVIGGYAFDGTAVSEFIFPETLKTLGSFAFQDCRYLKEADLGEAFLVKEIDTETFSGCVSLTRAVLPSYAERLGGWAFWGCSSLREVNLPYALKTVGGGCFSGCISLRRIDTSRVTALEAIYEKAFEGSGLVSFSVPYTVSIIDVNCFKDCGYLRELFVSRDYGDGTKSEWGLTDSVAVKRATSDESSLSVEGDFILDTADGGKTLVAWLGIGESVTVPKGVYRIAAGAFTDGGGLKKIIIPESVTVIEPNAFGEAIGLEELEASGEGIGLVSVDGVLYSNGGKRLIAYPRGRGESSFTVPDGVGAIGDYAFYGCMLLEVSIPETVTKISEKAFYGAVFLKQNKGGE